MWINTLDRRPQDNEKIFYYFEPFGSFHVGNYDSESDSVYNKSGFTSMVPEVPYWIEIPPIPKGKND
jgi:hypothetical protein